MLRRLPVAVALVAALGLAACGSDDSGDVSVPSAPTSTPTTQTAPPATQTTAPTNTTTTDTGTSGGTPGTTETDDSGGTSAPGTDEPQSPNERFKKYCEENPNACGE